MNIFVTGGSGFIGKNLSLELLNANHNVSILTRNRKNIPPILKDCYIIQGDIQNMNDIISARDEIDVVFHLAGFSTSLMFEENLQLAFSTNVLGFLNVLKAAVQSNVKKVIFASSSSVYGDLPIPHVETMRPFPTNLYGFSKLFNEESARYYSEEIQVIGLRYFSVYGFHDVVKGKHANLITKLLLASKADNTHPIIGGHPDYSRDYVFISDVVQASLLAMNAPHRFAVYNVGSGKNHTLREVTQIISTISGVELDPICVSRTTQRIKHTLADLTKIRSELGYMPKYDIKKGLKTIWESL